MDINRNNRLKSITYTGLAIALVTVATMIIRIPLGKGYVNFGDIMIFVTASLIGKRTGFLAGGIGSAIADIISGYFIYAPATLVIKGIEGLICALIVKKTIEGKVNILSVIAACLFGAAWMVLGYCIYEYFMFGLSYAMSDIPGNAIQGLVSAFAVIPIITAIKRSKFFVKIEN